jgi:hypothetical protein
MDDISGKRLTIRHVEDQGPDDSAPRSWDDATDHLLADKADRVKAQVLARYRHLAKEANLRSPDHMRKEGNLPDGKYFYAIRAGDIRSYGWFSTKHAGVFFVSHYAFKAGRKLSRTNTKRVVSNWKKIEST